ncbi:MAG: hypothetical protein JWM64_1062 [Frankiales bacterium]|nr:hypothetical protein [Frankiales bacterium]
MLLGPAPPAASDVTAGDALLVLDQLVDALVARRPADLDELLRCAWALDELTGARRWLSDPASPS